MIIETNKCINDNRNYDCDKRISLKTTFFVKSPPSPSIFPSLMLTFVEF